MVSSRTSFLAFDLRTQRRVKFSRTYALCCSRRLVSAKRMHVSTNRYKLSINKNGNACGIWVREFDATVLTLLYKGLLQRIGDTNCFADWPSELPCSIRAPLSASIRKDTQRIAEAMHTRVYDTFIRRCNTISVSQSERKSIFEYPKEHRCY